MRAFAIPLAILVALGGCKTEKPPLEARFTRAVMVDPQPVHDDRQVIGEVKPRYESDLSFRVAGKILARLVDIGASRQTRRHARNARYRRTSRIDCAPRKRRSPWPMPRSSKRRAPRRVRPNS